MDVDLRLVVSWCLIVSYWIYYLCHIMLVLLLSMACGISFFFLHLDFFHDIHGEEGEINELIKLTVMLFT